MATAAAAGISLLFLLAASHNYPGAWALHHVHALGAATAAKGRPVHVHIGVDAAMSGVSRFVELPAPWRYSKAEELDVAAGDYRQFGYALAAPGTKLPGFAPVHVQMGFERVSTEPPFFHFAPRVAVLRRSAEQAGKASRTSDFADDL